VALQGIIFQSKSDAESARHKEPQRMVAEKEERVHLVASSQEELVQRKTDFENAQQKEQQAAAEKAFSKIDTEEQRLHVVALRGNLVQSEVQSEHYSEQLERDLHFLDTEIWSLLRELEPLDRRLIEDGEALAYQVAIQDYTVCFFSGIRPHLLEGKAFFGLWKDPTAHCEHPLGCSTDPKAQADNRVALSNSHFGPSTDSRTPSKGPVGTSNPPF